MTPTRTMHIVAEWRMLPVIQLSKLVGNDFSQDYIRVIYSINSFKFDNQPMDIIWDDNKYTDAIMAILFQEDEQ